MDEHNRDPTFSASVVESIGQPLLALSPDLRVELANRAFLKTFKLETADVVGRVVYDIGSGEWNVPALKELLDQVLAGGRRIRNFRIEQESEQSGRRVSLVEAHRIPRDGSPDSIMLAISDVTERERLQHELEGRVELAEKLIDSVREALIILHWDLKVYSANQPFYETFQVSPEDTIGRFVYDLGNGQWNIPKLQQLLEDILPREQTFDDYEVVHDFETIGTRRMLLNARRLDHLNLIVLAIRDITELHDTEQRRQENETRQAYLLNLGDSLRPLTDPNEVEEVACRKVGEQLNANRAYYLEITDDEQWGVIRRDYARGEAPSSIGRHRLTDYRAILSSIRSSGATLVISNVAGASSLTAEERARLEESNVRALISVPLVKSGRIVAILIIDEARPRTWTPLEVSLVQETAERTWASVERAKSEAALRESEARYKLLFNSLDAGFCVAEIIFDASGKPADYRFLEVNSAFERQTGLKNAVGKTMRSLAPAHEEHWFEIYGAIALTGKPRRFEQAAAALGRYYEVYAFRFGDPDEYKVGIHFNDVSERKRQEEHVRLLMREVSHRAKNMLALVQAIARQTAAVSTKDFLDRFNRRIHALAASHDLLVESEWKGAKLAQLVQSQLTPFGDLLGRRIELQGPPITVSAAAAQTIGMCLHELATNSAKFGALSNSAGRVEITWTVHDNASGDPELAIMWVESGGPPVQTPTSRGFGTSVVRDLVEIGLGAKVELLYPSAGLVWRMHCPARNALIGSQ